MLVKYLSVRSSCKAGYENSDKLRSLRSIKKRTRAEGHWEGLTGDSTEQAREFRDLIRAYQRHPWLKKPLVLEIKADLNQPSNNRA